MSVEILDRSALLAYDAYASMLEKYTPLFGSLMSGNTQFDADDLKQEVALKFIKHFKTESMWFEVEHKRAYIVKSARNMASRLWERTQSSESIDDEESITNKKLSTEGASNSQMYKDSIPKKLLLKIKRMRESELSLFEQKLIQLNFYEGAKPAQVTEILIREFPEVLQKQFPVAWAQPKKERMTLLKQIIAGECNRTKAKYLPKLKKIIKESGYKKPST